MAPEDDIASKTPEPPQQDNSNKQHTSVSKLNDGELKALLDEAITYKNPKDREGKSALFKDLLLEAEENERNARAASAGGSELVRYCNPSAKRHGRNRRSETSCKSISENVTHGGSLNNLAKEELYEIVSQVNRQKKSVSARQREGGSLPCDVNVGVCGLDRSFILEEAAKRSKQQKQQQQQQQQQEEQQQKKNLDGAMEGDRLLEHDALNRDYGGSADQQRETTEIVPTRIPRIPVKYTSSAILHVGNDGDVTVSTVDNNVDKTNETMNNPCTLSTNYNVLISGSSIFNNRTMDDKKVDENGNALGQNAPTDTKNKKKKIQTEKNVVVTEAKNVAGHRGDIINDVDKLVEFIDGTESTGTKPKSNVHKSKLHKHVNDEKTKKQRRAASSKSKTTTTAEAATAALKKSNSLDEMSSSNMDDEPATTTTGKVALRAAKIDRNRDRRSWGNSETTPVASVENLESAAEFRVVTKKKKSKKRRNSISGYQQTNTNSNLLTSAVELKRTTACSVPHSEKSNDSSDIDSVHSLPVDTKSCKETESTTISYATIAKNPQQQQQQQKVVKKQQPKEKKVPISPQTVTTWSQGVQTSPRLQQLNVVVPPDVHNIDNFPAIPKQQQQQKSGQQKTVAGSGKVFKNGSKKVNAIPNKTVPLAKPPQEEQNHPYLQNIQGDIQPMPPNITDVRTIEKMHFAQVQQQQQQQQLNNNNNNNSCDSVVVERTNNSNNNNQPPAVVILSGETKEVSGLVFGFEINEKLLSDDVCDTFMSRFVLPVKYNTNAYNHDKIVSFIGQAWEDIVNSETNGNVQYYSENL